LFNLLQRGNRTLRIHAGPRWQTDDFSLELFCRHCAFGTFLRKYFFYVRNIPDFSKSPSLAIWNDNGRVVARSDPVTTKNRNQKIAARQQAPGHNEGRPERNASGLTPTPYFPGGAGGTGTVDVITSARRGLARRPRT
jgi:hypothetical protein